MRSLHFKVASEQRGNERAMWFRRKQPVSEPQGARRPRETPAAPQPVTAAPSLPTPDAPDASAGPGREPGTDAVTGPGTGPVDAAAQGAREPVAPDRHAAGAHPGTMDHLISEGVLLAEYAGRMALKNHIVVGTLTSSEPYDPARYVDAAREVLSDLARTAEESATLAVRQRESAEDREGASLHEHDYRRRDSENLRRREAVNLAVAAQLCVVRDNRAYLDDFIEKARQDAWAEIGAAIAARLDREWPSIDENSGADTFWGVPVDNEKARQRRLRVLRRDLALMARERS